MIIYIGLLAAILSLLAVCGMSMRLHTRVKMGGRVAVSPCSSSAFIREVGGRCGATVVRASANELGISGAKGKDREEKFYDFGTAREELDEDALFEREMAQEMYDMLRGEDEHLSIDKFFEWDDIKDVIEMGVIDPETMALIIEAAQGKNPVRDTLTFEQWLEAVELVNQVQLTLENVEEGADSWDPKAEQAAMDELYDEPVDPTSESVMQMLQAFGLKPNVEEKKEKDET